MVKKGDLRVCQICGCVFTLIARDRNKKDCPICGDTTGIDFISDL